MTEYQNSKQFDPKTIAKIEDSKQLVKSSGSIGANYIEANESLSKKDFILTELINETIELTNIFGSIIRKCE